MEPVFALEALEHIKLKSLKNNQLKLKKIIQNLPSAGQSTPNREVSYNGNRYRNNYHCTCYMNLNILFHFGADSFLACGYCHSHIGNRVLNKVHLLHDFRGKLACNPGRIREA